MVEISRAGPFVPLAVPHRFGYSRVHTGGLSCQSARIGSFNQDPVQDRLFITGRFRQPGSFSPVFEPSGSSLRYLTWRASSKFHSSAIRRFSRNFWMAYLTVRGESPVIVIISLFVHALPALSNESTIHEEGGSFMCSSSPISRVKGLAVPRKPRRYCMILDWSRV